MRDAFPLFCVGESVWSVLTMMIVFAFGPFSEFSLRPCVCVIWRVVNLGTKKGVNWGVSNSFFCKSVFVVVCVCLK